MVLEVYKKHQLPYNEPYQMAFFIGTNAKIHQEHQDEGNQTALPFLNNNLIIN